VLQDRLTPCFASKRLEIVAAFVQRKIPNPPMEVVNEFIVFVEIVRRTKLRFFEHGSVCGLQKAQAVGGTGWITLLPEARQLGFPKRQGQHNDRFAQPTGGWPSLYERHAGFSRSSQRQYCGTEVLSSTNKAAVHPSGCNSKGLY